MYSATTVAAPPAPKDVYRRRDALSDLLNMSRAQRRARGVKAPKAQIQHELGAVEYLIGRMEDTAISWNVKPDDPAADTAGPNGNRAT